MQEMERTGVFEKTALFSPDEWCRGPVCVALTGLTMAEYFRMQHQNMLLFIDNIFRYVQAGSEVSALLGRLPSAVGYQPTPSYRAWRIGRAHHLYHPGLPITRYRQSMCRQTT